MKKRDNGITLISLVVTVMVLSILASVLVTVSIQGNPVVNSAHEIEDEYYNEKKDTESQINKMVNGWENVIL